MLRLTLLVLLGCFAPSLLASALAVEPGEAALAERIRAANAAVDANPQGAQAYARRAALYAAAGELAKAIADYDALLKLEPERAEAYDQRGSLHFMRGEIDQSIADFDRFLKLRPDQEPWHWKRGISYYYAGRYDEGRRQFEGYQTVDDNDVENAVWRFLCMARGKDLAAARGDMLKIKRDPRVPMTEIYELFAGRLKAADVLAAARAGNPSPRELNGRLFYAHLYLGLLAEVEGDLATAREHLKTACQHRIGHYMWNVADVHAKRLAAGDKN